MARLRRKSPNAFKSMFQGPSWEGDMTIQRLGDILEEANDKILNHKVNRFITMHRRVVNTILAIEDDTTRNYLVSMFYKQIRNTDSTISDKDILDRCIHASCQKLRHYEKHQQSMRILKKADSIDTSTEEFNFDE
jgi:hypothetical protein